MKFSFGLKTLSLQTENMASRKFYQRLLYVAGIFLAFFAITVLCFPFLAKAFHINLSSRPGMLFAGAFQAIVMFIAPALVASRVVSYSPASFLHLDRTSSWLSYVGVVFAYLIFLPALNQIIYWNQNLMFPESWAYWGETLRAIEEQAEAKSQLMLSVTSFGAMIVNLLIIALLTGFAEELLFRGTFQSAGASSGAHYTAIWVVALLFSAMHMQFFGFIPRLLLGAWFGYLLFWTRSIYVPAFAHFLNNGVVVVCSWLTARGSTYDFEHFGVTEYGFPLPAFISALAFVAFILFFKNFFFSHSKQLRPEYV